MCLDLRIKTFDPPDTKERVGYKVYSKLGDKYEPPFYRRLYGKQELGVTYTDTNEHTICVYNFWADEVRTEYQAGYHVLASLAGAKDFRSNLNQFNTINYAIVKVMYKNVVAKGVQVIFSHDEAPGVSRTVYVAREITLLEECDVSDSRT